MERHYGRKPRTKLTSYLNFSLNGKTNVILAKPETLQVCTISNNEGHHDQLVMKAPCKLKEVVSNKFPYIYIEKKVNKNKFESAYDTKPQIAVAGTKHTITTDKKNIIYRKRVSTLLKSTFQNPLSRRGENQRGTEVRYTAATFNQSETTAYAEQPVRESTPILEESTLKTTMQSPTEISPMFRRGKRKLIKDRGQINVQLYLEKLNESEDTQHSITTTIEEHPNVTTVTDEKGNTDLIE